MAAPSPPAGVNGPLDARTTKQLSSLIDLALEEDVGAGDVTTLATIPPTSRSRAHFLAKEDGVLSGLAVASFVFARIDPTLQVEWTKADGDAITKGTYFGTANGRSESHTGDTRRSAA
jgi:nicotinate-nucleotide pyrophosphorylase (carboxylating)